MAYPEQICSSTDLLLGNQANIHGSAVTFTNYIVKSARDGSKNDDREDVQDAAGALYSRITYSRFNTCSLVLICKTGATPLTDFPDKAMATLVGLTAYFVNSCVVDKTRGPNEVTVELENIGIT